MAGTAEKRFESQIQKWGGKAFLPLPFHPDEAWGQKGRHCLTGTIGGKEWRGTVGKYGEAFGLPVGPAWTRDNGLGHGDTVEVVVKPEGPQLDAMAEDLRTAIEDNDRARIFFNELQSFHRNNYFRWIDSAKRVETRAKRIREMVRMLAEGKRM